MMTHAQPQPSHPRLFPVPRAAEILVALPIPEELDEFLTEQDVAQTVLEFLAHCRRPLRVSASAGQRRVTLLGAEHWTLCDDAALTVHRWCAYDDRASGLRACPPHQVEMLDGVWGYPSILPVFTRLHSRLEQRHGHVHGSLQDFLNQLRHTLEEAVFTDAYRTTLCAMFRDALGLDPQAWRLAQSLIGETHGMRFATLGHYLHTKRHLEAYLSVEREAPALLSLLDHLADRLEPGEDPKKGLKRVLMQAGVQPAFWRLLHRQPSSRVARARVGRLLDRFCGMLEPHPCTLLRVLPRVQAIVGRQWPCDVLLGAMLAASHHCHEEGFIDDGDAACRFAWSRLDSVLPVVRRLQEWFEQGQVTDSFPGPEEVLCEFGLVGGWSWIGLYELDARFAWTTQWHRDVIEVVGWAVAHPQAWDHRRLRQWNFEQLRHRASAGEEGRDGEDRHYARLPAWQTPYSIDLGLEDVQAFILTSALDFLEEGRAARNCLAPLWEAAHEGVALYVSLRPVVRGRRQKAKPRPLATLRISLDARVSLQEVRGFANSEPSKRVLGLARQCAWQVRRQHWMRRHATDQQDAFAADERKAA